MAVSDLLLGDLCIQYDIYFAPHQPAPALFGVLEFTVNPSLSGAMLSWSTGGYKQEPAAKRIVNRSLQSGSLSQGRIDLLNDTP